MNYKQYIGFVPLYYHRLNDIPVYYGCRSDNTFYDYHRVVTIYNIGQIMEILRKDPNVHFYNTPVGISWYLPGKDQHRIYLNKQQFTKIMVYSNSFH